MYGKAGSKTAREKAVSEASECGKRNDLQCDLGQTRPRLGDEWLGVKDVWVRGEPVHVHKGWSSLQKALKAAVDVIASVHSCAHLRLESTDASRCSADRGARALWGLCGWMLVWLRLRLRKERERERERE